MQVTATPVEYKGYLYTHKYDEEADAFVLALWREDGTERAAAVCLSGEADATEAHLDRLIAAYEEKEVGNKRQIMIVFQAKLMDAQGKEEWPVIGITVHDKKDMPKHEARNVAAYNLQQNSRPGLTLRAIVAEIDQVLTLTGKEPQPQVAEGQAAEGQEAESQEQDQTENVVDFPTGG